MSDVFFYGLENSGKTTLVNRVINDKFIKCERTLVELCFKYYMNKKIADASSPCNVGYKEVFNTQINKYTKLIYCIDANDVLISENIEDLIDKALEPYTNPNILIAITKIDLLDEDKKDELGKCMSSIKHKYVLTSAKDGTGIKEVREEITTTIELKNNSITSPVFNDINNKQEDEEPKVSSWFSMKCITAVLGIGFLTLACLMLPPVNVIVLPVVSTSFAWFMAAVSGIIGIACLSSSVYKEEVRITTDQDDGNNTSIDIPPVPCSGPGFN